MLLETNVVGKKIDWAEYVTLSDEHETPLLRRLPKGKKPVNVTHKYQADKYEEPEDGSHPEGKPWSTFKGAGAQRVELDARVQYFVETASVGKLAQDVTETAGVKDELATEITKKMTVLARRMESAAGSDQAAQADNGESGHKYRGLGKWLQADAQDDADTDVAASIRPPAASLYTGTKANFTENALQTMVESSWRQTGYKGVRWLPVGTSLKKQISSFQFFVPSSLVTQSTARVTTREQGEKRLGGSVDVYDSDWGTLEIELSAWLARRGFGGVTTTTVGDWRGYMLTPSMYEWKWNQKPTTYKPEYKGGSYQAAIEAILMFLCKNTLGEGKIAPSDA